MRQIDDAAIKAAGARRFESEYHYALFEYLRSAKVIRALERAGVKVQGRILDAGCGGGGTALSLAEESRFAVGIDIADRFAGTGTRLGVEKNIRNAAFAQADGSRLPFRDAVFDLVFSHSVIEHVFEAEAYLAECRRVLKPGGSLYLSTAPYLSLDGSHFPRLKLPVPLHLLVGRKAAFWSFRQIARHAPFLLKDGKHGTSFIALASEGKVKEDDLHQRVTVKTLGAWIERSGFRLVREDRHVTGFFKRALPGPLRRWLERTAFTQDVMIGHIECVLEKA
jgi:ubiquinone/menaquinone biosynthesis C-methylase UbiE